MRNETAVAARPETEPGAGQAAPGRWLLPTAFFLATTADASSNAFLPVFAGTLSAATPAVSANMAAGMPIAAFWLMVAVAQLTAGVWERGRDHRRLIVGALVLLALAQALSGLASSVPALIVWRGVGGFATGVVMILVQDGMLRGAGVAARTRASGTYLSAFFAGTIAGTLGGGGVAAQAGHGAAFLAAAAVAGSAALIALRLPSYRATTPSQPFRMGALLRNPAFTALVVLGAMPSRLLIAAFLYYLAPLRLHDLGLNATEIGWVLALYAAIMATTAPLWSHLIDASGRPLLFALGGLALSAIAMAAVPLLPHAGWSGMAGVVAGIVLLGTAQAMGMAPQVTLLFTVARPEMERFGRTPVLGVFRVFERAGLFTGPLLAGVLVGAGHDDALIALALLAAVATPALAAALALTTRPPSARPAADPEAIP